MSRSCTICHMLKLKELTPLLNCRRLSKAVSCHHRSSLFGPSAIPTFVPPAISRKRSPNFFASALVRNPSRCCVKRSAVLLFFVSTPLTDLQKVFCFKKIDQLRMWLRRVFSTIFIVCFSIVCRIVTIFDCRHVLLGGMLLHRHSTNQLKKMIHLLLQRTSLLLPSRGSVEDIVLRSVQLVCWITHTASVG